MSTERSGDRPAASDGGPVISHTQHLVALPCSPLPQLFCDVLRVPPPAMLIDQWGPGIGREQHWGPVGDRLPPTSPFTSPPAIQLQSRR